MATGNISFDFAKLSESEIAQVIHDNQLSISAEEAVKIQEMVGRAPTLSECILWGIQGSEHCSYKTSRIHLKKLTTDGPNVILGAKEDAGVVEIARDDAGEAYGIVISHESHNHPSQIVPFEGAATGIGGNVRDVCCMGATVIANADSLRFGALSEHKTHWIYEGVVEGIASYSNALGVPNLTGDVQFDPDYNDNCLVTAVTLGVVKASDITHSYAPTDADGYDLILVGKPTDNSGFGGASFSSIDLEEENEEQNRGAVQEPNAFLGRVMLKSNYALFEKLVEKGLIERVGFKDLGAGGIACASVELAEAGGYGAEVCLDDVHVAMQNLNPAVLLCSETQERYMWVCPPDLTDFILQHYNEEYALPDVSEGARATVVGKVRDGGRYTVTYQGEVLIDAKATDITSGIVYDRPTAQPQRQLAEPALPKVDLAATWLALLGHENIASTQCIDETYDKQVQGRTLIERGQADAGVMAPFNSSEYPESIRHVGIALAVADNPRFGKIDPYWASVNAVVEAMGSVVAVGATPEAMTDCLCFGNPELPEQMADFVQSIEGLKYACENITLLSHPDAPTPIVAGNVSLYNQSKNQAIPASPMISCLGKLGNVQHAVASGFVHTDSRILMVGSRLDECGGSVFYQHLGELGANLPKPDLRQVRAWFELVHQLIQAGHVAAAKWIGYGGVAVNLAKMSFQHEIGFSVALDTDLEPSKAWFTESPGFILEIPHQHVDVVKQVLSNSAVDSQWIGQTSIDAVLDLDGECLSLSDAQASWQQGLRKHFL